MITTPVQSPLGFNLTTTSSETVPLPSEREPEDEREREDAILLGYLTISLGKSYKR